MKLAANELMASRLGLLTHEESVALIRSDCDVCKSEGLGSHTRIQLRCNGRTVYATLYQVTSDLVGEKEVGLSDIAWQKLGLAEPKPVSISPAPPLESMTHVRTRIYGGILTEASAALIVEDIVAGRFSDIQLTGFVSACAAPPLSADETIALTRAMVETGDRLVWPSSPVFDKHCIGGLPGNRTTPLVVAIAAANGLLMPKTSSRAITSPAGTADTMETLTKVDLDLASMRRVVEQAGGCFVWGDSVSFSPADTAIIRIERALDMDAEGLLVASVLSKKIAAGATHIVIDMPMGPTAKVRSLDAVTRLSELFRDVAEAFGVNVPTIVTDGRQPVGRGIGPALEAADILAVLENHRDHPADLRDRACLLAGEVLEMAGLCGVGEGAAKALETIVSGRALSKFEEICEAQGGRRTPPLPVYHNPVRAARAGRIVSMDNRRIARIAKLAGAPEEKAAGLRLAVRLGDRVEAGDLLFTLFCDTPGEQAYALDYVAGNPDIIGIEP